MQEQHVRIEQIKILLIRAAGVARSRQSVSNLVLIVPATKGQPRESLCL
jgi:hypothetical protein